METLKFRLFSLGIVAISAAATHYNWMQLNTEGRYSMKMAVFAPIGIVCGIFLFFLPEYGGKPNSNASKVIIMLIFAIGVAAGVYNLFLMDPSRFGM